ncbi:winged helix-turn-helix domain-containing protein [Herbaspirillum sp. SJZ107]|uniref:winged helix-turn-helix domain-containing protein n=1 Tax=Herbaspirillum sp. SJZ107 TaxID=2572881 RepID=UPI00114D4EBC|nr:winged helix-turn-helix domain-containing protein [Herbaspirillum sp. SJZ107]TQK10548.1 two-component system phosphate regulon response regulator PhoB [Herbaspirillum sp. SJZ107]
MSAHVLVVDPDPAIRQLLALNLTRAGHDAASCLDAESALVSIDEHPPEMLLLEWDLPGQSGQALIRRLRAGAATRELPIIMLSARAGEHDKILALESGADDYLTKPFNPRELLARIGAVLRRRSPPTQHGADALLQPHVVQMAGLRLDPGTQRVMAGARQVALGPVEFRLLNFLMHHPERVHSRSQLLDQVWGRHAVLDERTVDTHVGRLRNALQPSGHQQRIETVRGSGYRFVAWRAQDAFGWDSAA